VTRTPAGLPVKAKRKREPIYLRVVKGGFEPAAAYYAEQLRARKFKVGDLVRAELVKPRNPRHHRLVFGLLSKVAEHLDTTTDALLVLVKIRMGLVETIIDSATGRTYYVPASVDFENMDQGAFAVFHRDLSRLIARTWLPEFTPDQVAALGEMMDEA
jgi:hypothetical protein